MRINILGTIHDRCNEEGNVVRQLEIRSDNNTNTLTTVQKDNVIIEQDDKFKNIYIRKLTQKECWRLMGFQDKDYEKARNAMNSKFFKGKDSSGSQLYKQAGNSVVVNVLIHIYDSLYKAMPKLFDDMKIGSFFSGIGAFETALRDFDPSLAETTTDSSERSDLCLEQIGYINNYNGDANRIYNGDKIARTLKSEAGGGGALTGWYAFERKEDTDE